MGTINEKILEIRDLDVTFKTSGGELRAVRNLSFDLYKGETLSIVGESGSGKSVTARAIMGILSGNATICGGEILYEGRNLIKMTEREFHEIRGDKIAMIFQDPMSSLNPIMRVGKQLTEITLLKNRANRKIPLRKIREEARNKALKLMEEVGIPEPEKRFNCYPFEMSGGQRQRIVIAIALAANPEILICDEPTTALDVTVQSQILELINRLKIERKLSVIFITHDLGVVANMADRIAVMYAGKIVEYGTAEEIFYQPKHPYTWALLSSAPDLDSNEKPVEISGTPPNMTNPPIGDAFAERNKFALKIDYEIQPPFFKLSETHYAATWLLHENAPKVELPESLADRINRARENECVEREKQF